MRGEGSGGYGRVGEWREGREARGTGRDGRGRAGEGRHCDGQERCGERGEERGGGRVKDRVRIGTHVRSKKVKICRLLLLCSSLMRIICSACE